MIELKDHELECECKVSGDTIAVSLDYYNKHKRDLKPVGSADDVKKRIASIEKLNKEKAEARFKKAEAANKKKEKQ